MVGDVEGLNLGWMFLIIFDIWMNVLKNKVVVVVVKIKFLYELFLVLGME